MMDDATLAMSVARFRIVVGIGAVVAPGVVIRVMGGQAKPSGLSSLFVRMLGGRDVALGLGTVIALDHGAPVRGWVEGGALADGVDALSCLLARRNTMSRTLGATAGLSATSAIVGIVLSRRLDPPPSPHPGQPEAVATGHSPVAE